MDRFERRREKSKEEIRRAAEDLFSKHGIERVSINDIAESAGVSQATVYNNFGTKDELVSDYRKTVANRVADQFRDILIWKKAWIDKFQDFLQSWIDFTEKYRVETAGRESRGEKDRAVENSDDRNPGFFAHEIDKALLQFIEEGKKQGQVNSQLSDEAVSVYVKFFQEGLLAHPEIQKKINRDPQLTQDLLNLFRFGINGRTDQKT